jgi:hypothetical protein
MQSVQDFLTANDGAAATHATAEYLDLIGLPEHGAVEKRRLLVAAATLGKTPAQVAGDIEAIDGARKLHRLAMEIANHQASAGAKRSAHNTRAQEAKGQHDAINAEVERFNTEANMAEQNVVNAKNAALDLAKLRTTRADLFGQRTPYAGLNGEREVGDESNLHYGGTPGN